MMLNQLLVVCAIALSVSAGKVPDTTAARKRLVTSRSLQRRIDIEPLLESVQALEDFAYASPGKNRLMGTQGHNDTVTYLYNELTSPELRGYYNVTLQPWRGVVQLYGKGSLIANGVNTSVAVAQFSPSGNAKAPLVIVKELGCDPANYPSSVAGKIALILRGSCDFRKKSVNAGKAGAIGAIIYNNAPGRIQGMTIGSDNSSGTVVPTVGISKEDGLSIIKSINSGRNMTSTLDVKTKILDATTYNVLAETKGGDDDSVLVLGAHTDSVEAGPGINDDGTGTVGILEVAKQLAKYRVRNQVRFGFWSGEEEGLLGSTYYVQNLSPEEKESIKLYLNFDMLASPNYQFGIFDGDGGDFNITGPKGSADIELMFEKYFESQNVNYTSVAFTGRSDYDPFVRAGIPAGGLETGAEGKKTKDKAEQFGGTAGIAFDINYHGKGDNVTNLNLDAFLINTKAIAHSVATYARSFDSVTFNDTLKSDEEEIKTKRDVVRRARVLPKKRDVVRRAKVSPRQPLNKHGKISDEKFVVRSRRYREVNWF